MKLKVKKSLTALSSPNILLMCNYTEDGVKKKFILDVAVGSSFVVEDHIGVALLSTENLAGVITLDNGADVQRKMVDPKRALDNL